MFTNKEYVLEVFKEKNFSKAAKNLYISQPSLSASIKRIETKISAPIFDRSTNPLTITEIGEQYIKNALEIKKNEDDFLNFVNDNLNILKGEIRIGGTALYSSYTLPPMITKFNKLYPDTKFKVHEAKSKILISMLIDGELDIVIDNSLIIDEKIASYLYTSEIILLAVPKELEINKSLKNYQLSFNDVKSDLHTNPDFPCVSLDSFKKEPFILLKNENDTGKKARQMFRHHGFSPSIIFELDQQATAFNISCQGIGISFVSDTLIKKRHEKDKLVYYKLSDSETNRNIYFYVKNNHYLSNACRRFIDINTKEK